MTDTIKREYARTGESCRVDGMGMREMQRRAYAHRDSRYLLLKAPPASGKSRALMFVALDKLEKQGIKKAVIAVPEQTIAASFGNTELKKYGFFADWTVDPRYNLCAGSDGVGKVDAFCRFVEEEPSARVLLCTHATLRFACEKLKYSAFDDFLVAVDEFHHVSADSQNNRLGDIVHRLMAESSAHIFAMTGSYFRGDRVPVLPPEDEGKFDRVTYTYYEQLNGYVYLKSIGIGHHFYRGKYLSAIGEVLDTDKKTLVHIPNVNSIESTGNKYAEVDAIIDIMGERLDTDPDTGIIRVRRKDGKILKVADIVDDTGGRQKTIDYLRAMRKPEDVDVIIALGMAKEGFDWPYCEHALTVGARASLTELVQIIGRCTRDSENKTHAQFTNLIAQPDADEQEVGTAVNTMLKAVSCSLLMEQVLAPNFKFKRKLDHAPDRGSPGMVSIRGLKPPSERVERILESDLDDIKAKIIQDPDVMRTGFDAERGAENSKIAIKRVIGDAYPYLDDDEKEELRQHVVADIIFKGSETKSDGDRRFIKLADNFVNVDELSIDLIDSVNPFQKAYEILSKNLDKKTFRAVQNSVRLAAMNMTDDEAVRLFPEAQRFREETGRNPDIDSPDPNERKLAGAVIYLKRERKKLGL